MDEYTFTYDQLYRVLSEVVDLRDEYINVHGKSADDACDAAILEILEELDAEQELMTAEGDPFQKLADVLVPILVRITTAQETDHKLRTNPLNAEEVKVYQSYPNEALIMEALSNILHRLNPQDQVDDLALQYVLSCRASEYRE